MRWSRILGVAGSAVASATTGCVGYCYFDWDDSPGLWSQSPDKIEIPVDAAPWLLRPCGRQEVPDDCALIVNGVVIPVTATVEGECDLTLEELIDFPAGDNVVQTLHPSQPLPPGAIVTLDCEDPYNDKGYAEYVSYGDEQLEVPRTLKIRASTAPAAPPGKLTVLELQYTRDDPNVSCREGDSIEVRVDFDAPFLREGGYILVTYPTGQVFQFSAPDANGIFTIPPSRGILKFTPVAIDGERGETVEVDASEIADELVYIPGCAQSPSPGAPALLVPVVWLALRRRRSPEAAP